MSCVRCARARLRIPQTGSSLRERASRTLCGQRLRRYLVAVDAERVVGGFELFEGGRLQALVFEQLPFALRALNLLVRVLPRDGELRQASISGAWYLPGREDVGRALWAYARAASAQSGNAIGAQFDPHGPLRKVIPLKPWTPKRQTSVAVRSPVRLSEARLLSPP